jgi:hypothetical protein
MRPRLYRTAKAPTKADGLLERADSEWVAVNVK